jgi:hypothetical protein
MPTNRGGVTRTVVSAVFLLGAVAGCGGSDADLVEGFVLVRRDGMGALELAICRSLSDDVPPRCIDARRVVTGDWTFVGDTEVWPHDHDVHDVEQWWSLDAHAVRVSDGRYVSYADGTEPLRRR